MYGAGNTTNFGCAATQQKNLQNLLIASRRSAGGNLTALVSVSQFCVRVRARTVDTICVVYV